MIKTPTMVFNILNKRDGNQPVYNLQVFFNIEKKNYTGFKLIQLDSLNGNIQFLLRSLSLPFFSLQKYNKAQSAKFLVVSATLL